MGRNAPREMHRQIRELHTPRRMLLLRRPGWGRVALGALARVLWFLFGVPCAWSLPRGAEREGASWGTAGDEDDARLHHDDCDASSPHVSRVDALRRAFALAGAADVPHVAGAFDEHLANVSRMLASWDLPEHVALAGYGHTLYGSELFPYAMGSFSVAARARARAAFGRDAEALMFLYGTCSQKRWYRSVLDARFDDDASRDSELELTIPEQVNAYTGERARLSNARFAFLCAMHAADIASTLPSPELRDERRGERLGGKRGGSWRQTSDEQHETRSRFRHSGSSFTAGVFCSRLLRVAAAAVQSDAEATRRFPTLERALLDAAKRRATEIGSDARAEKAEVERLRRCTFDAWLVARATGVA